MLKSWSRSRALLLGASFAALAAPALAQQAAPAESQPQIAETVVVTATGRQAALQDVPIAVTAVSAAAIQVAGVTDVRNLQQLTPSYRVATGQSNSAGTAIAIRGIGTGADNPGFEGAVGVFIDGVYRNRSGVALGDLPQIERIEVLRGPQGTLFGRNTSSGAVSIVTAAPSFERNVYGKMEGGDLGYGSAMIGFTGPLTERLAVRFESSGQVRDGIIADRNSLRDVNNRDRWFMRGQALFDLSDTATLRVIYDKAETDEECCTASYVQVGGTGGAINLLAALRGVQGIPAPNPKARYGAFTPGRSYGEAVDEQGVSAQLDWEIGGLNLTAISSFRDWNTTRNQDIDFNGSDRAYRDGFALGFETTTHEIRLQGENGRLNWLVGAFYAKEKTNYEDTVRFGADGGRYADILAAGAFATAFGIPAAVCNPGALIFTACPTIYASLPGQSAATPLALTEVLWAGQGPALTQSLVAAGLPAAAAAATARQLVTAFGQAVRATAPTPGQGQQGERTNVDMESLAFFTHNEISLSDRLNLTLGLRYNTETKDMRANLNAVAPGCGVLQSTAPIIPGVPVSFNTFASGLDAAFAAFVAAGRPTTGPLAGGAAGEFLLFACNPVVNTVANGAYADSREEKEWSGTASLQYDVSDSLMVYATFARGYKSGGFNLDRSAFSIRPSTTVRPSTRDWQFAPEFVDNYEFGWKWSGLPGRTTLNGALFWQNISDYQINAFNGFNFFNFNAPSVISRGVELDLISRPAPEWTFQGGLLWNEAFYDGDTPVRNNPTILDGTPISGASEWTLTGSVTYRRPIEGTRLAVLAYLDGRYQTEYRTQTLGRPANGVTDQEGFGVLNARLGVGAQDGSWSLEAWARNLADQFYWVGAFGVPEQGGSFAIYPGEPRTMGVTLRANF